MITIKTNINVVATSLIKKLEILRNPKPLLRPVALDVLVLMTSRIHEEGKAADVGQIGTYNNNYLRLRQKCFKRSADKKIIVSQTRQLENDWSVIGTGNGWGIGFKNNVNAQKLKWVEEIKKKKIGALTASEKEFAITKFQKLVQIELNK
jgi:hypothetical protein